MSIYKKYLIFLILCTLVIRCFLAWYLELSHEETYYWTYALFPDLSHFDNPPMVGWLLQFFTHNLEYDSPFFLRLMSLILGILNTIFIFIIGVKIKNEKTGWYGALLYTFSIYGLISLGVSASPEVPQSFLWLVTTLVLVYLFSSDTIKPIHRFYMVFLGIIVGVAILCKYNSIFLGIAILFYVLFFQKNWLKKYSFYMAIFITLLCCIPILWWNIENRYIGFYRTQNLPSFSDNTYFSMFIKNWIGQIVYYNPINLLLALLGFAYLFFKPQLPKFVVRLFLCLCIPMWVTFSGLSFFKSISVQWVLVGGLPLLLVGAAWLADAKTKVSKIIILVSGGCTLLFLCLGIIQREYNIFQQHEYNDNPIELFKFNGWEELNKKFTDIRNQDILNKKLDSNTAILAQKWYQASSLDYYIARPNKIEVKTIGFIKLTFEYASITNKRGGFKQGDDFYFITSTQNFDDPYIVYAPYFKKIILSDTIPILRHGRVVNKYLLYKLYDLKNIEIL